MFQRHHLYLLDTGFLAVDLCQKRIQNLVKHAKRDFFFLRKKLHFRSLTGFWLRLSSCNRNSLVIAANSKLYQLSKNFILQKIFCFKLFRVPLHRCFILKLFCQNFKNACGYYFDNFTAWALKLFLNLH